MISADSLWHLALIHPRESRELLFPLLESLSPDWNLARLADEVELALLEAAAEADVAADEKSWDRLVHDLASDCFQKRQAADVALRSGGQGVAAFLVRLDPRALSRMLHRLARRGLWQDTLVICGGEFGRMPMSEQGKGRDHNPWGYTVWLAGGGVKPGMAYGATDPVGLRAVDGKVHVHDLHATILHLLGLDHESLTFPHNGRDERLTDVAGKVVTEILA